MEVVIRTRGIFFEFNGLFCLSSRIAINSNVFIKE